MGKSFKARKKARNEKKRNSLHPRIDSTAGVVLPSPDSVPPPSAETSADSIPPSSQASEPPPSMEAGAESSDTSPSEPPPRVSEPPPAPHSAPKITIKKAEDSGSHRKVKLEDSGSFDTFFAKTEEDIHHEEARREAPDLHDPEIAHAVPRRRPVDPRAHRLVAGVVGLAALLGLAGIGGALMRKSSPKPTTAAVATQAPPPVTAQPIAPAAMALPEPTVAAAVAPAPAPTETAAAPVASASAAASASETAAAVASAPPPATASAAPTETAAVAPSAAPADPDDALSGGQLLAQAKSAIAANNASRAAALAKKAIAKGAGGSAYYVLGAAYQTMGSNGAAKSAYNNCAKSGCPEAGECASLVDGL